MTEQVSTERTGTEDHTLQISKTLDQLEALGECLRALERFDEDLRPGTLYSLGTLIQEKAENLGAWIWPNKS
ncbi:MAG: hypothetical protein RBR16_13885 [Syntrophus sp. (in: bacteria)]|nr:hypothetical protein [Syntrophus sp. (in: bacteria)]